MAATEEQLVAAIRADPDELDNYIVYGDWLAERGDARGELIGLSAGLARTPGDRKLASRVKKLQGLALAGYGRKLEVRWKLGFVEHVRIRGVMPIRDVLAHPLF